MIFFVKMRYVKHVLHGNYKKAIEHKCVKGSRVGTLLRVFAMKLYKATKVFDDVDQYICTLRV